MKSTRNYCKAIVAMLMIGIFSQAAWAEVAIPALRNWVTDRTNTLSKSQVDELSMALNQLAKKTSAQVVVLMVQTTGQESIEEYAVRVFEKWQLGQAGDDKGLLLVVAKKDRTLRIEVGYGLEGVITDVSAAAIINNQITPQFKKNNYYAGIKAALVKISNRINRIDEPVIAPTVKPTQDTPNTVTTANQFKSTQDIPDLNSLFLIAADEISNFNVLALLGASQEQGIAEEVTELYITVLQIQFIVCCLLPFFLYGFCLFILKKSIKLGYFIAGSALLGILAGYGSVFMLAAASEIELPVYYQSIVLYAINAFKFCCLIVFVVYLLPILLRSILRGGRRGSIFMIASKVLSSSSTYSRPSGGGGRSGGGGASGRW